MMQSIRSLKELRLISQSRNYQNKNPQIQNFNTLVEDSGQRKRYLRSKDDKKINLPNLPKVTMQKWKRSKDAVSRFLDDLTYDNEIQSSYDLTLIDSLSKNDKEDAA